MTKLAQMREKEVVFTDETPRQPGEYWCIREELGKDISVVRITAGRASEEFYVAPQGESVQPLERWTFGWKCLWHRPLAEPASAHPTLEGLSSDGSMLRHALAETLSGPVPIEKNQTDCNGCRSQLGLPGPVSRATQQAPALKRLYQLAARLYQSNQPAVVAEAA